MCDQANIEGMRHYDAAQDTVIIMSSTLSSSPTNAKSSRTVKVNPILYASPLPTRLNGILLHTPSCVYDRFSSRSTGGSPRTQGRQDGGLEAKEEEADAAAPELSLIHI